MTTAACGYSGTTNLAGAELIAWTAKKTLEAADVTNMNGGGAREWVGCLDSWDGTLTTNTPCALIGLHTSVEFTNAKETISGDVIVTSMGKKVSVEGVIGYSYNWVSTGKITVA